ncbi:uncharacterized protein Z520_03856 [Fonsecaea multimorphosa CBS 102226]|uniref:Uncharacterized protein n=1 Tax=Fonsecaea multimorphosa CBS 102226 TaxID=1442371 RepID=A0A0D2HE53_9EURO|nr:uncharacterized protein Z520_03856 [Fonsecaea multimorphosa CBS 102226]KIY00171.1 hypothetical protein Z520_03856 [Fonsecaea multimorphosa CBS 102226]OAL27367.1 hypothetical protein AYO22_03642 [Fonsecaea multimorphosa]
MVTTVVETGASPERSRAGKNLWNKVVDVMLSPCSGSRKKSTRKTSQQQQNHPLSQLQLQDPKDNINWSTSTLGMETDLNMNTPPGLSMEDAREIPLSSMPWYPPPPSPALLPPTSSRSGRSRRGNNAAAAAGGHHATTSTTGSSASSPAQRQGRRRPREPVYRDRDWEYQTYGAWIIF